MPWRFTRVAPQGGKWKNGKMQITFTTPCLWCIASGVLSMGRWVKVRLPSVELGSEEGLPLICGPLAGFSWNGTPAKWAHEKKPYLPNNPTQALYTQPSGLGPKYTYILM